jgi:tRNA (guanine26-N2/guanine27-N2)-dimethyltransferase
MMTVIASELRDSPLFYDLPALCHTLRLSCPPIATVRSAILNANYQVSQSHCDANALKTDAPVDFLYDMLKAWIKKENVKSKLGKDAVMDFMLSKEPKYEIDWTLRESTKLSSKKTGITKFPPNPEKFWGPKSRAGKKR